ncbi:GNAT family N-acetyltransferase [Ferrovum sp.]|uniref:GNAT family N-acetyltransferase n=1 Tax=Ferrovum sp. TaxID=2609467 RepID=UPI00260561AA|nr:GNAT family N-acetyltransferase [Ferrovum sp.]
MNAFDMQPTLEGGRVMIRPLRPEDFDDLYAVASDKEIWTQHPVSSRYQEPVFRKLFAESLDSGGALVAIDKSLGKIVGSSRFRLADAGSGLVEIGWSFLARSHWGGSYNAEVKYLLLAHAFRFIDVVCFRVGEGNLRSRRAMEKIGGRLTDRTEIMTGPNGEAMKHVIFEIDRNDFAHFPCHLIRIL